MVLGIGGCRGMSGAITFAGRAALTVGAGLVRLAVPDPILETVAVATPESMTVPLRSDRRGRIALDALPEILEQLERVTAVALGPGLGRSLGLSRLVERLYATLPLPLVVDADALNALAERGIPSVPNMLRVLTPHRGEFERLYSKASRHAEASTLVTHAADFAARHQVILVLKGVPTLIAVPEQPVISLHVGNPGMATGGSGDLLTGILAGLLAQAPGINMKAATLIERGVRLHGLAGDLAAASRSEQAVTAGAILDFLPEAIRQFDGEAGAAGLAKR